MRWLARLPIRRFELLFCAALVAGCIGVIGLAREEIEFAQSLTLVTMEVIMPLSMGLVSAGLLAGDPALEVVLTMPKPAWRVLAERLSLLFGVAAGLVALLLVLVGEWNIALPADSPDLIFIWLSPLVFYLGLANAAALRRGRSLDGTFAVVIAVGISLVSWTQIPKLCARLPTGPECYWWLVTPSLTLAGGADFIWALNRLVWLAVGIGLLALSFSLTRREEPLLPQGASE